MSESVNEFVTWATAEPGDLLYRAETILDCLGFMVGEQGAPGEGVTLPHGAAEGFAFALQHVQELVRLAAARQDAEVADGSRRLSAGR